jgi:hypothetical protein
MHETLCIDVEMGRKKACLTAPAGYNFRTAASAAAPVLTSNAEDLYMTISRHLKFACLIALTCAFTATACPSGQGSYGSSSYGSSPSNGSSLGGAGTGSGGSIGTSGAAAGSGGAAGGGH